MGKNPQRFKSGHLKQNNVLPTGELNMDTVPQWLQIISAILVFVGSLAGIVGNLWPVFVREKTLPELLRERLSSSQRRDILSNVVLIVLLLILVGSSAFLGSLLIPPIKPQQGNTQQPTPKPEITKQLTQCPQPVPTPGGQYIISGTVWNDPDKDGQWNNGEQPVQNLTAIICLVNSSDQTVQTVRVNGNGGYAFSNLSSGIYSLISSFTPTNPSQLKNISIGPNIYKENIGYNG